MSKNTCNVCGANLIYKDGRWVCPACGAYKEEEISNEEVTLLYNASQKLRLASFDDAEELYADIVKKYPKNSEAHWGLVLSRYGIKYEDDYDGRKLPTCYAATMESFLDDKEYLAALSCAPDAKVKAYYEEQGKIIEKNRIEWYEKASKEPAYDVFLCFKDSDKENNIERTDDSIEVANLYTYLSGKGYRVFFSRETLRDKVAEKYEPYIYNALNTASVMIVYGSKPEYFESVWMKNEWTRFLKRMREGLKVDGSLIVAYDGMNPAELPKVFAGRQCLDARKKTFYGDLETLIARVIAIAKRPKAAVERIEIKGAVGRKKTSVGTQIKTIQAGGAIGKKAPIAVNTGVATREIGQYEVPELTPDEETKTKTVFRFLSAGLFDNAKKAVEEVLKNNHYNSRALFAKLLVHYEAKNETELAGKLSAVDDFEEIKTVIAYNDKSIGEKIISALSKQVLSFMESGEYSEAIRYLREIAPYNSDSIEKLKSWLNPYAFSLLAEHPDASDELFATLLETYTDADTYIPYLQDYVNQCLQNNRLELAKKYNDKVVELDDGDLNATLISMYLSVSANCLADFIEKADAFTEFAMLDSALRKFDSDEVDGFFATMEKIISGLIGRQANGDAICRWFDFVTKYEFARRQDLIRTTMASLAELSDCKKRSKLFDSILACIDSADVDQHITLRMEYAASMQGAGEFSLAEKYYKQVLDIEEGNCEAMFGRILCHCGAKSEQELSGTVDQFEDFKSFETLLRYCPDEDMRCKYLNTVLSAINERSKSVTDKATIARLASVFDGIVKYYPEDRNKELLSYTMQFAANAKNSSAFETAEKYYAVALSIDHLCHEAYWGLLQTKLSCRNNDDLIHQKTLIGDMPEFSSAIAAAGDDDRSADRYVKLAKEQRDYLRKQRDKDIRHKKIKRRVTITATLLVFALLISGAIVAGVKYYQSESILKYDPIESGYSIVAGKFYKSATVELPHTVNEKPLTVISAGAFKNNKTVETVIIPSSVTTIEAEAFSGCTNLKTIVFKSKTRSEIITLSVSPMSGSIKTESGVISIGDRAFYGCENLSAMDLSSIRSIGENAFDGCKALAELTLSDQLTTVKAGAFSGCASLKTVYLPATVEYLGRAAFSGCVGLESVVFEERDGGIGTFDIAWREGMSDHTKVDIGFKLTLDYGKSTGSIGAKTVAVIRDGNFSMPVPVRAGYTFVGWFTAVTDGEQLTDAEGKSLKKYDKDEAIILYAVFEANANKVSFDANGGTGSMPEQTIYTDEIAKLVANTFAKAGYTFVGWATAPDGKKVYNDTQSVEMGMESFTLYAVWEAKINTIHFDANGGSGEAFSQDIATDETRVLTKNTYTKNGYTFIGWATTPSGAIAYADQESYTMGTDASYTLYAVWKLVDYSVSYELNGGVDDRNPTIYNFLSDSFTLHNPMRPGYTFLGWSGTGIDGLSLSVTIATGSVGNRSYTANWKANENTLHFDANGGNGGSMSDMKIASDAKAALLKNGFTRSGYEFAGWAESANGSKVYSDEETYSMGLESSYTLYALWKPKTYSITYKLNGGQTSESNKTTYDIESDSFSLVNPVREGYIFVGWSGSGLDSNENLSVSVSTGTYGDLTFTANWKAIEYQITYDLDGGQNNSGNPGTYTIEQLITLLPPTKTGYTFKGWSDGGVIAKGSTGEKTFTAIWEISGYKINYNLNGGINHPSNPDEYNVDNDTITLKEPTRLGYRFIGWSDGGVIEHGSTGAKTFTASWEVITYKIIYILDGGVNAPGNSETYTVEDVITLIPPTKVGYRFDGWSNGGLIEKGSTGDKEFTAIWSIIDYKISYELNGGINHAKNPESYTVDSDDIMLNEPTRLGYRFIGWSDGGVIEHGSTGVKTFTASWEVITYKITYILDGGVNAPENSGTYTVEDVITLVPPTKAGYHFDGWSNGGLIEKGSTGDKEFTATWSIIDYKISYELNGGTNHAKNPESYTVNSADITLNEPTRPGYRFVGWSDGGTIPHGSTGDKTFVAQWEANSNTIKFDPNGGNGTMSDSTMRTDESAKLLRNTYTRTGYVFAGWATEQGGVVQYKDESLYTMGAESEVILYAVWTPVTYRISYDLAGGNETSNPGEYNIETDNITLIIPTRPGYTFTGWSGTGIDGKQKLVTISKGSIGERQYTANWEANRNTIVFHPNGGTGTMENQTIPTDESQALTRNGFSKVGYTFAGWAISSDTAVKYQDGVSYTMGVEETYHLYAIWTPNQNTLTFDGNGATSGSMDALRKYSDEKFTLPGVGFTKTGYSFKGWSKAPNGTVLVQDGAGYTMDCQDQVILYAVWEARQYTITLNSNGGTINSSKQIRVTFDTTYQLSIPTPGKLGYQFAGWYNGTTNEFIAFTDETGKSLVPWNQPSDITLYAVWNVKDEMKNFQFISDAQNCEISGIYDKSVTEIIVPAYVTKIAFGAFEGCNSVEKITLPFVGDCESTDESHPKTFGYIFGGFLADSDNLYSYVMSNQDNQVFQNGYHENNTDRLVFYIPSSIRHVVITKQQIVPAYAFEGCDLIESISISNTTTTISKYAFWQCKNLKFFIIPNSVTLIESAAFTECISLERINSSETGLAIIPEGVQRIGTYAFNGLSCITKFELPLSLTMIEGGAFANCIKLEELYIPNNVSSIGDGIVTGCIALSSLEVSSSNSTFYSEGNCIIRDTTLLAACKSSIVPNDRGITRIGALAFSGYEGTLVLPGTITFIDDRAFRNCNISCIKYEGTIQAWKQKVLKNKYWDEGLNNYVVQCEDGTIENP